MSRYTKQDIVRMVEEEDVEFIRLQFTDIAWWHSSVAAASRLTPWAYFSSIAINKKVTP